MRSLHRAAGSRRIEVAPARHGPEWETALDLFAGSVETKLACESRGGRWPDLSPRTAGQQ
jgi:hypothetical protein